MTMKHTTLLIFFEICLFIPSYYCNTLCSTEFCNGYLATESCIPLPEACEIQNTTHNGVFLPSPGPCNCCEYCVENLDEGEQCAKGDPSIPTATAICGHSLTCVVKDNAGKCVPMNTPCTQEQLKYDIKEQIGTVGHLETRAVCDRNGFYAPYKCIPGEICYCVSEEGDKIFGEIPFTSVPHFLLTCGCSRKYNKAKEIQNRYLNPDEYFRCQSNGDYDTIQCIDDKCFCVDSDDGKLTYPHLSPVNTSAISQTSLLCFNNKTHVEAEYYRNCESSHVKAKKRAKLYLDDGYSMVGAVLPNCQLDGLYAPLQETITHKYCSDPLGNLLENFKVLKTDDLAKNINCNCARARYIIEGGEKPKCCLNGNYKKIQERRGVCRCVDANGQQTEKEVECENKNRLSCYNSRNECN